MAKTNGGSLGDRIVRGEKVTYYTVDTSVVDGYWIKGMAVYETKEAAEAIARQLRGQRGVDAKVTTVTTGRSSR